MLPIVQILVDTEKTLYHASPAYPSGLELQAVTQVGVESARAGLCCQRLLQRFHSWLMLSESVDASDV